MKNANVRLPEHLSESVESARIGVKEKTGRRISAADIVIPALMGFVEAAKQGKADDYLRALPKAEAFIGE